jgi:uncharacterized protein YaaN involved in tellurite resistance
MPTLQPVVSSVAGNDLGAKDFSAGTIDESMLSDEEKEIVNQFASEIDIENVDQVVNYGIKAQTNISDFSVTILKKVKTYDLGDIGISLRELTVALDATTEPEKKGILGVFQKAKQGVGSVRANYAKAESNVDRIEKDLQQHRTVLTQDISMYQQMYELNVQYYKELTMYIIAGKKALAQAQIGKLQELKEKAESSEKQEDVQAYRDYEDLCNRFEKKLADLEITRVISIQSAPQVRMLQNNDREMLDKLQSSLANTIPLWRNQLVLSLGLEHTSRALKAQGELADKTNELLKKNSETLKMATVETAKQSERPIVDIDTLKQCNRDLISSINEVVKIHEQGTVKRAKAQEELVKIEEDLKQAMMEAGKTGR